MRLAYLVAVLLALPGTAEAACSRADLAGKWIMMRHNSIIDQFGDMHETHAIMCEITIGTSGVSTASNCIKEMFKPAAPEGMIYRFRISTGCVVSGTRGKGTETTYGAFYGYMNRAKDGIVGLTYNNDPTDETWYKRNRDFTMQKR